MEEQRERRLSTLFDIGLFIKAIEGTLEIFGAIAIVLVPRNLIARVADIVTAGELSEDPRDFMANHIRSFAHAYALHAHDLFAIILTLDGTLKVVLVVLILMGFSWGYPLFVAGMGILGCYEAYRAVVTGNLLLYALVIFDVLLILLVAYEYRRRYSSLS